MTQISFLILKINVSSKINTNIGITMSQTQTVDTIISHQKSQSDTTAPAQATTRASPRAETGTST